MASRDKPWESVNLKNFTARGRSISFPMRG
ncbi:hypothetical protein YPPY64_2284, partial [Yersinia pestis PY-64]